MDHISTWPTPEDVAIGEASPPPAGRDFSLVSFGKSGNPQPLPQGLVDLPLFPDRDGFFSVNGPLDFTVFSPLEELALINSDSHSTIGPLITDIPGLPRENADTTLGDHSPTLNDDANIHQQARSGRRGYFCHQPGCAWRSSFLTKQALDRHNEVKHLNKRVDCPVPGCEKVGVKGIKRKDNLPAHVWNKHGIKLRHQSHSN